MNSRSKYETLFEGGSLDLPVFVAPWYLDAVCGRDCWDVALVEKSGQIRAAQPYFMSGEAVITMPPLTQVMGPWIRAHALRSSSRLSVEKDLMCSLIEALPPFKKFRQCFNHSLTNWLPFYWAGFQQSTRYTYRFEDLSSLELIWDEMSAKVRNTIRKSEKNGISIVARDDLPSFQTVLNMTFERQGLQNPHSPQVVQRLYDAACENDAGELLFAVDSDDRIHAASFLVWNRECAYNLAGGADPELRSSGAHTHLLWGLVKAAADRSRTFDFEGSMVEGIERVFRGFGATQTPYFSIWRDDRSRADRLRAEVIGKLSSIRRRLLPGKGVKR